MEWGSNLVNIPDPARGYLPLVQQVMIACYDPRIVIALYVVAAHILHCFLRLTCLRELVILPPRNGRPFQACNLFRG